MATKFVYKPRSPADIDRLANQKGANEFESFVKNSFNMYAPRDGDNSIRILPTEGEQNFGINVWVHYQVGPTKASVLCPARHFKTSCPICEDAIRAERKGEKDLARELTPTRRVLIWMLDKRDEDKGPLWWAMPWTVDRDIHKIEKDREDPTNYRYVDDPVNGYNVYFDRVKKNASNPRDVEYVGFQLASRPTSVDDKILDFVHDNPLNSIIIKRTSEEVRKLYEGLDADKDEEIEIVHPVVETKEESVKEEKNEDEKPPFEVEEKVVQRPVLVKNVEKEEEKKEEVVEEKVVSGADRAAALRARFAARK